MFLRVDPSKNIWDLNPSLALVEGFALLISKEGKRRSSNIMWSIYLAYHPSSAVYKVHEVQEERNTHINKTYNTKDSIVDFSLYTAEISLFKKICIPVGIKSLDHWEKTLQEYDDFTDSLTFLNSFKLKKEALLSKKEIWDLYINARDEYFAEETNTKAANRGGYQESATETGSLFQE